MHPEGVVASSVPAPYELFHALVNLPPSPCATEHVAASAAAPVKRRGHDGSTDVVGGAAIGAYSGRLRSFPPVSWDLEAVGLHFVYVEMLANVEPNVPPFIGRKNAARERSSLSVWPPGPPLLERG